MEVKSFGLSPVAALKLSESCQVSLNWNIPCVTGEAVNTFVADAALCGAHLTACCHAVMQACSLLRQIGIPISANRHPS